MVSMHVIHKDITIKSQRMIALDKVIRVCVFKFRKYCCNYYKIDFYKNIYYKVNTNTNMFFHNIIVYKNAQINKI